MSINYIVNYSTTGLSGSWTPFNGQISTTSQTITGLNAATNYYVQVIAIDTTSGIQGNPVSIGPLLTTSAESASGTVVTDTVSAINASPTPGSAGSGNLITIVGGQVAVNGTVFTGTSSVTELYYINHTAYQMGNNLWWGPITVASSGTSVADPRPVITDITLSSTNFTLSSSPVTVGAIATVMTGASFNGSVALSGAQASMFVISSGNLVANPNDSLTSYAITLTATYSGTVSGVAVAPFAKSFTITAQSGASGGITTPAAATAAGFTNVVFFDDFTTDTFNPAAGSNTGYGSTKKWFTYSTQTSPTNYQVFTTSTAAATANGNSGGGTNASPSGGIARINYFQSPTGGTNNSNFMSMPTTAWGAAGTGAYRHAYFEAYIQFVATGTSTQANGWPAFWSFAVQAEASNLQSGSEIDFLEVENNHREQGNLHYRVNGSNLFGGQCYPGPLGDNNWHTYGCLWVSTGTGTGAVSCYFDNVKVGSTIATGTGSNNPQIEANDMFVILGTGAGWPMFVDWVRVWK